MFASQPFIPPPSDPLELQIEALEHRDLEETFPEPFDLEDLFAGKTFLCLQGITDFWSSNPNIDFMQCITDLVISAHAQPHEYLTTVMAGIPGKFSIYLSFGSPEMTRNLLDGLVPGLRFEEELITDLHLRLAPHFRSMGLLSGIPSRKDAAASGGSNDPMGGKKSGSQGDNQGSSQLERVVRGMHGATWAYVIQAYPRSRRTVVQERLQVFNRLAQTSSLLKSSLQTTTQESYQRTVTESGGITQTQSAEQTNYLAQYLSQLLERQLERLNTGIASGQWTVQSYLGAQEQSQLLRLSSLLLGTLSGKDSRPAPLRTHLCQHGGTYVQNFSIPLNSEEVAQLIQIPREEVPGYAVYDFTRFDVDFRVPASSALALGKIQYNGRDSQQSYSVGTNDLAKHGVVMGVTGSGKTTTMLNLLDHAIESNKPFLIIEPAKTEYRSLRKALEGKVDFRIYTLGNENVAPFRFNPFEFETNDKPGSGSLLNHVDFLKAVFNAAFILYAPMPYVLETALHEIYEDKGWDLASGINTRLPDWSQRHLYPIYPTMTDLYRKVEEVTKRLNFDGELEQNVTASLQARIGSLRLGSKGLMLDTPRSIPIPQILRYPTVLELESIGNDDEKTFLMGMLLSRIYEYRRLQASTNKLPGGLQHLLVFEEAHRLLKNTSTSVDTESANPRAQAVEVFVNMLAEIRGYGQGCLVAEQIPSKLAPDVLKNTNLKIAHRLVAQDDRESVGQTMNLNEPQKLHLGTLLPGMAAVFAEGMDHAYLLRMENYKSSKQLVTPTDEDLRAASPVYASLQPFLSILDLKRYGLAMNVFGGPEASIYQAAGRLLDTPQSRWIWASIITRVVWGREYLMTMVNRIYQQVAAELTAYTPKQQAEVVRMIIIRGCEERLHERGAKVGWSYPLVEQMRILLTQGLLEFQRGKDIHATYDLLDRFSDLYQNNQKREHGPFPGCSLCRAKCLYRNDLQILVLPEHKIWISKQLEGDWESTEEMYKGVAQAAKDISIQIINDENQHTADLGYCGSLHIIDQLDVTEYQKSDFGNNLAEHLLI